MTKPSTKDIQEAKSFFTDIIALFQGEHLKGFCEEHNIPEDVDETHGIEQIRTTLYALNQLLETQAKLTIAGEDELALLQDAGFDSVTDVLSEIVTLNQQLDANQWQEEKKDID